MDVLDQLQWRANVLLSGRYEDLARQYDQPLPVFLGDQRLTFASNTILASYFKTFHSALNERGIAALAPTLIARELPRKGRFRLWVQWDYGRPQQPPSHSADCIYYCRSGDGGLVTEMIQYTRIGLPDLCRMQDDLRAYC